MRKALSIAVSVLSGVVAVLMAGLALVSVLTRGTPGEDRAWLAGMKPMLVLGGSMEPAIHVGGVVVIRRVSPADIRVGDVITFRTPATGTEGAPRGVTYTTHRVTRVNGGAGDVTFETKGDANEGADGWVVTSDELVGRVVLDLPYVGYVSRFATQPLGLLLLIILPAAALIVIEVRDIVRGRRPVSPPSTAEEPAP